MQIKDLYKRFLETSGIVTDTRKDTKESMFFALKGGNFNGNKFAKDAISNGAKYAVIDEERYKEDERYLLVKDSLKALQNLARHHRKELGTKIFALTGTNGKTTTKELISSILGKKYKVLSTTGNFNNHIGVPLTLLKLRKDHEIGIVEMGANKPGDIKELSEIAEPDYGLITNIGIAHLEGFGNVNTIQKTKGELFDFVRKSGGVLFANQQEKKVMELIHETDELVLIGDENSADFQFVSLKNIPWNEFEYRSTNDIHTIQSALYGVHNYENLKVACGIGLYFNVKIQDIIDALNEYQPSNNRSQIIRGNGVEVYLDAYNANPSSVLKSLEAFHIMDADHKYCFLGDMLELGESSKEMHQSVIKKCKQFKLKNCVFIGEEYFQFSQEFPEYQFFKDRKTVDQNYNFNLPEASKVFVKASRGIALEKLDFIQSLLHP